VPGSRTLLDLAHRYDAAGQLAETDDDLTAEGFSLSQTFVYDDLRRLVGHTAAGKSQTWRYSDDEQIVMDADGVQITATRTYYDGEPEQGLPLGQLAVRSSAATTPPACSPWRSACTCPAMR